MSIITVGSFQLVVSVAVVCKELVVVNHFGTGDSFDAFLIAFLLPSLAMNIVAGSFHAAFIPEYVKVREQEGREAARGLFANVLGGYLILLIAISLFLMFISPVVLPILGSRFGQEKLALTHSLYLMLLPTLVIMGLTKAWGSLLNAEGKFALVACSPMVIHSVTVILLLWLGNVWGIHALTVGIIGGFILEGGLLLWGLHSQGLPIVPRWSGFDPATRRIIHQYLPMIGGAFLMGGMVFIDQAMAAMLGPGSVSTLNYGSKIIVFILGIGSMALSTAIFPHFSKMVAHEDWRGIRHTLRVYARLILIITVPLTLLFFYFSEPLVRLVFERGAFTEADTRLVGQVQAYYSLQFPFYILGILGVRLLSALARNQTLMVISGVILVANIIGNYVFMHFLGVAGISLSTSVVYVISVSLIFLSLSKQLKRARGLS